MRFRDDELRVPSAPTTTAQANDPLSAEGVASVAGRSSPGRGTERYPDGVANYVEFKFFSGLRPSEITALRWADVDLERDRVHVHRAIVRGRGAVQAGKARPPEVGTQG